MVCMGQDIFIGGVSSIGFCLVRVWVLVRFGCICFFQDLMVLDTTFAGLCAFYMKLPVAVHLCFVVELLGRWIFGAFAPAQVALLVDL